MANWQDDDCLESDLKKYVLQGIQRKEILDFLYRDYSSYTWSLRSLDRRLRYFNIFYVEHKASVDKVRHAVQEELDGPGRRLGTEQCDKK